MYGVLLFDRVSERLIRRLLLQAGPPTHRRSMMTYVRRVDGVDKKLMRCRQTVLYEGWKSADKSPSLYFDLIGLTFGG